MVIEYIESMGIHQGTKITGKEVIDFIGSLDFVERLELHLIDPYLTFTAQTATMTLPATTSGHSEATRDPDTVV